MKLYHYALVALFAVNACMAEVITSVTKERMLDILKEEGYVAEVAESGHLIWKIEGYRAVIHVEEAGRNILFRSSIKQPTVTLQKVNRWNMNMGFSRAYIDDDGDSNLELDIDLDGGVTHARIVDYLKTCRASFSRWLHDVINSE